MRWRRLTGFDITTRPMPEWKRSTSLTQMIAWGLWCTPPPPPDYATFEGRGGALRRGIRSRRCDGVTLERVSQWCCVGYGRRLRASRLGH